jgi:DNA-binding NtrC family response regulator
VIALHLPALRDRSNDVLEIAEILLQRQRLRMHKEPMSFTEQALLALQKYSWPGNVRELENALERAVILCEGTQITTELMGIDIDLAAEKSAQDTADLTAETQVDIDAQVDASKMSLEDYFQHFVLEHQEQMTETELARKLGISRKCLWERRQRFGIPRRKSSGA